MSLAARLSAVALAAVAMLPVFCGAEPDVYRVGGEVAVERPARVAVNVEFSSFAPWNVDQRINAWNLLSNLEPMVQQHHGQCDEGGADFARHHTGSRFSFWDCGRSGYWDGAEVRFYRLEDGVLRLVRTATVLRSETGNDPATNERTVETISFEPGPAVRSGDFYVLRKTFTEPSPFIRPALLGNAWGTNALLDGWCNFQGKVAWRFDTNTFAPEGGSTASLRMELSEASEARPSGPWHWFLVNNSDQPHIHLRPNPGKSYRAQVWLRQEGMSDPRALVQLGCYTSALVEVGSTWKRYEFDLPVDAPATPLPARQNESSRLLVGGLSKGTLWMDNLLVWQTDQPPFSILPYVRESLQAFRPGALRLWGGFTAPSLDYWLREGFAKLNKGDYGKGDRPVGASLFQTLELCRESGADPWLVLNPFFTEREHAQLMEYLAGPADTGYGRLRAAQGRAEPWTTAFTTIYLEHANESWNQIFSTAWPNRPEVYAAFADRQFRELKASPYYERARFSFVANGWDHQMQVNGWTHRVAQNSREADVVDMACYFGGWEAGANALASDLGGVTADVFQDKLLATPIEFGRNLVESLYINPDLLRALGTVLQQRPDMLARGMENYSSSRVRWVMSQLEPPANPDTAAAIRGLWAMDTNFVESIRSVLAHRRKEMERAFWNAGIEALAREPALQAKFRGALNLPDDALLTALAQGIPDLNAPSRLLPLLKTNEAVVQAWLQEGFLDERARRDLLAFAEQREKLTYDITNELNKKLRELIQQLVRAEDAAFIAALLQTATPGFIRPGIQLLDYQTRSMFFEPAQRRAEQLMLAMKHHPSFAEAVVRFLASGPTSIFQDAAQEAADAFAAHMGGLYSGAESYRPEEDAALLLRQLPAATRRELLERMRDELRNNLGTYSRESQLFLPAMLDAALGQPDAARALARNPAVTGALAGSLAGSLPKPFIEAALKDAAFGYELIARIARNPSPGAKRLAVYEGGPGYALPGPNKPPAEDDENIGKSAAMGTATLDCFLQFLSFGVSPLAYYQFKSGSHWASHNNPIDMIPYPSWLALQLVNQHARGDLLDVQRVRVSTLDVPDKEIVKTSNDGKGRAVKVPGRDNVPLSACHVFRDGAHYVAVFINRDFRSAREIQLELPAAGAKPSRLYELAAPDPTTHNRTAYNVRVAEREGPPLSATVAVTVPPAGVVLLAGDAE